MKTLSDCTSGPSNAIFAPDALPERGGDMKIWHEDVKGVRWYFVDRAYRRGDGRSTHFKRKTTDPVQHARHVIEAQSITGECSLTSKRFAECISTYLDEHGPGGFSEACYARASRELGRLYPDKPNFAAAYAQYCAKLEASRDKAVNTVNNYKTVIRTVCNYAHKTGRCGAPSIRDYQLKKGNERDRILSPGEELAIENKLREWDSHLLQPFLFALRNPIRKRDLFNRRRDELKMELVNGQRIWVLQFVAHKTSRMKRTRITTLPNITREFLDYVSTLPGDCPWLFPMIGTKKNGIKTKLRPGKWRKILDADKHFNTLLRECGIQDFKFHDLKHCAETYMIRQGYHYEDLQKLGIQMSNKTQRIYDNRDQLEIVAARLGSTSVAPEKRVAL